MTTKIDDLSTHYLIPGSDLGSIAVEDPEGTEEDYADAPYSQMPPVSEMPSPTGWQDMLGLNQVSPSASQIDPPPYPASLRKGAQSETGGASFYFLGGGPSSDNGTPSASPKVQRMMGMLAGYDQAVRRIRARASIGGGQ